ncbi:MAG: DUF4433 domain-containing protein [Propionibacteriaceae bacterium]|jgi:hypothetical protein|nr:DUF4433 domain-containing protein [Propionibacteriaceae bacterium]
MAQTAADHLVYHFTHVSNLAGIVRDGLLCDSAVSGSLQHEAGDQQIKRRRRQKAVPCDSGGVVADYVPFYFAPRSPMMYRITNPHGRAGGGVATYGRPPHELVYLVSSVERLRRAGLTLVLSDRNAATEYATFCDDPGRWFAEGFIDWAVMRATYWSNTPDDPDRMERRMAECLVHRRVPWDAVASVATHDVAVARQARAAFQASARAVAVEVKSGWYF